MKVYIATSGSYSDYRIEHVFRREEDASTYADALSEGGWDGYEVLEGPVERRTWYQLTWWPHLAGFVANPHTFHHTEDFIPTRQLTHTWSKNFSYKDGVNLPPVLKVEGWSEQDVLKVYSEQRAMYLAAQEGIS